MKHFKTDKRDRAARRHDGGSPSLGAHQARVVRALNISPDAIPNDAGERQAGTLFKLGGNLMLRAEEAAWRALHVVYTSGEGREVGRGMAVLIDG